MSKLIAFRSPDSLKEEIDNIIAQTGESITEVLLKKLMGLPSIEVEKRSTLPEIEAVYLVWSVNSLLYIGQTKDLKERFRRHCKLVEFLSAGAKVAWFSSEGCNRLEIESELIHYLQPELNQVGLDQRVKKSVRLDIQAIAIISDYAAKHGCNETDALNRLILTHATHEPPIANTTTHEPLADRVLALETQMSEVVNRLDAIDRDKTHPIAPPLDTGLEPVAINSKRSPESSFISDKGGTSTSEFKLAPDDILIDLINQGHRAEAIAQHLNQKGYTNTKGKPMTRGSVNSRIGANSELNLLYAQTKS